MDSIGIKPVEKTTLENDKVYQEYLNSVDYQNGQYLVKLPWKDEHPPLPSNYRRAKAQLMSLLGTFEKDSKKFELYDKVIKDQLDMGFIERVNESFHSQENCHYLPHHGGAKNTIASCFQLF